MITIYSCFSTIAKVHKLVCECWVTFFSDIELRWRSSGSPTQLIVFINIAETKPFTILNSRYLLTIQVAGRLFNPFVTVSLYKLDVSLCVMFQDASCDKFSEMRKLFTVP